MLVLSATLECGSFHAFHAMCWLLCGFILVYYRYITIILILKTTYDMQQIMLSWKPSNLLLWMRNLQTFKNWILLIWLKQPQPFSTWRWTDMNVNFTDLQRRTSVDVPCLECPFTMFIRELLINLFLHTCIYLSLTINTPIIWTPVHILS